MRIGILTYHRSNNYGAFMQAYSLSSRLKKDFPECNIKIIDYISEEVYLMYHPSVRNYVKRALHAQTIRRKISYLKALINLAVKKKNHAAITDSNFEDAYSSLPLTSKMIVTDKYKKVSKYINDNFDIVIVGSDAVWNWQIRPFPNPYFLGKEFKPVKFSYAASSYGQPYRNISSSQKKYLKEAWSGYVYVGVRDVPTEEFVSSVVPNIKPTHNCDPTVLLEMDKTPADKNVVLEKLVRAGYDTRKKTIGVMAKPWLFNIVKKQIPDGYQLVSLFNFNEGADVNALDLTPFEWAIAFSFFDITITHYFHGNLLSLKSGTPTLVIEERTTYNQQYCSKIRDFMQRVGLDGNCYYLDEVTKDGLKEKVNGILTDTSLAGKIESGLQKEADNYYSFKDALTKAINKN